MVLADRRKAAAAMTQANQMRDVLLENQLITRENKNSTAAGQAQGLRVQSRTLPCPWLTETETATAIETETETETETTSVRQCGYKEQQTNKMLTRNLRSVGKEALRRPW